MNGKQKVFARQFLSFLLVIILSISLLPVTTKAATVSVYKSNYGEQIREDYAGLSRYIYDLLVSSYIYKENVTEKLKANSPIEWVRKMNNIRNRATEIVNTEVIFI